MLSVVGERDISFLTGNGRTWRKGKETEGECCKYCEASRVSGLLIAKRLSLFRFFFNRTDLITAIINVRDHSARLKAASIFQRICEKKSWVRRQGRENQ